MPAAPVALTTRSAVTQRVGERVEVAVLGVRALGERTRVLEGTVQDADRSHAAMAKVLHGEGRHLPGAHDHDVATLEAAERFARRGRRPSATNASGAAPSEVS